MNLIILGIVVVRFLHNPNVPNLITMAADTADPLTWLLNLGTAGAWVVCTMTGLQPTRAEVRRLEAQIAQLVEDAKRRDDRDRSKDEAVEALVRIMTTRTLPGLATAVEHMPAVGQAGQMESALGKKLEDLVARVERVLGDERST